MEQQYFTVKEAAAYLATSESWLNKLRMGVGPVVGPKFIRIGLRSVRYKRSDLDAWMLSRVQGS